MIEIAFAGALDLRRTLFAQTSGAIDPTSRLTAREWWRATRTPAGPATLHVEIVSEGRLHARAFGPGADWVLERAAQAVGLADRVPEAEALPAPAGELARRAGGQRLARYWSVCELLVPLILQQRVRWREATRAHARWVRARSDRAPGPMADLWLPLAARALRELAPAELARLGVEGRRAAALREVGWRAARLDAAVDARPSELERMLAALPGLGPWTIQALLLHGLGHPDAVPLGDLHLPRLVAWSLAGEPSADDARMLELLAPWSGQRGRLVRWLLVAGQRSPRAGPRRDATTGGMPGPGRPRGDLPWLGAQGSREPDPR